MVRKLWKNSSILAIGVVCLIGTPARSGQLADDEAPQIEIGAPPQAAGQVILVEEAEESPGIAEVGRPVEIIQERYPGGELKIRREVTQDKHDNYILHGEWKMWDEQGNLTGAGEYRNDRREGPWFRIHTGKDAEMFAEMPYKEFTPPFRSEANFKDGQLEGKWIITDSQGRTACETEYVDGLREGVAKWSYASGTLMREASFHKGLLDGFIRTYDANSTLIEEEKYENGHKIAMKVEYNEAGQKQWEAMYMYAQLVIDSEVDWWNAQPATFKSVGEDVKHGLATGWHPNGQMRIQGVYNQDEPDGQFTWWYANGQEEVSGSFKNGLKDGLWVWRHPNGQKSMMGQSQDGTAFGIWYKWQEDGRLVEKTDFSAVTEQPAPMLATKAPISEESVQKPNEEPEKETPQLSRTPLDGLFVR